MNVLRALAAAGYDTGKLPEIGQAFIERLASGPTNDLTDRKARPGGELYAVTAYKRFFSRLPEPVREAIIARWGAPEDDPFVEGQARSEEHTSELQSLMRISYAVFCLKKKKKKRQSYKAQTQPIMQQSIS